MWILVAVSYGLLHSVWILVAVSCGLLHSVWILVTVSAGFPPLCGFSLLFPAGLSTLCEFLFINPVPLISLLFRVIKHLSEKPCALQFSPTQEITFHGSLVRNIWIHRGHYFLSGFAFLWHPPLDIFCRTKMIEITTWSRFLGSQETWSGTQKWIWCVLSTRRSCLVTLDNSHIVWCEDKSACPWRRNNVPTRRNSTWFQTSHKPNKTFESSRLLSFCSSFLSPQETTNTRSPPTHSMWQQWWGSTNDPNRSYEFPRTSRVRCAGIQSTHWRRLKRWHRKASYFCNNICSKGTALLCSYLQLSDAPVWP